MDEIDPRQMWLPEVDSPTKPKLKVSFSGGRTSAYMAKRIKDEWAEARLVGVQPYVPIRDMRSMAARQFSMDFESGGCTESCEAYPMEMVA